VANPLGADRNEQKPATGYFLLVMFAADHACSNEGVQDKLIPNGQLALGQQPSYFLGGYNEMRSFTGIIDEFRLWTVERDGASIKDNYQRQLNPKRANGLPISGEYQSATLARSSPMAP